MSDSTSKIRPVSGLLTGSTDARRENIVVTGVSGATVAPDPAVPAFVTLGSVYGTFADPLPAVHFPYQVGDNIGLRIQPAVENGTRVAAYVWRFWDGTTETSSGTYVTKRLNLGGNPLTGSISFDATAVGYDGQFSVASGGMAANNPPTLIPPSVTTANGLYFPFQTRVVIRALDLENQTLGYSWWSGDTYLGAGTTTSLGVTPGTWTGNGTTMVISRSLYENAIDLTVENAMPVTAVVYDTASGTSQLDFNLYGYPKPPPVSGLAGGSSTDNSTVLRIGIDSYGSFSAYAKDASLLPVSFQWQFAASNGWSTGPVNVNGVTSMMPDGGYTNSCTKDLSGETISGGGTQKTSTAIVFVTSGGVTNTYATSVTLVRNRPPTGITFTAQVNGVDYNLVTLPTVAAGAKVMLIASATDPDHDLVEYKWTFLQPAGVNPSTLVLWGAKVVIDTTGYAGGSVQATVVATDSLGGSITETTPAIPIT